MKAALKPTDYVVEHTFLALVNTPMGG